MTNPVFVVSTGRAGTTYFSRFFRCFVDNVSSYHTTKNTEIINVIGNLYSLGFLPRRITYAAWRLLKYKFIAKHPNRYIESNPYYYGILDIIAEDFQEARFVVIVRSPKSYVLSRIRKENQNIRSKIANCLIPFWQPLPYRDHLRGLRGEFYGRVEFYARVWNYKNRAISETLSGRENAITLKFEDVFDQGKGVKILKHLLDWLGLAAAKELERSVIANKVNATERDDKDQWDGYCDDIIRKHCGKVMTEFDYTI